MTEWFCLDCKRKVEVYQELLRGFAPTCKNCGGSRLMAMEKVEKGDFKKLVKEFKKRTGEVE